MTFHRHVSWAVKLQSKFLLVLLQRNRERPSSGRWGLRGGWRDVSILPLTGSGSDVVRPRGTATTRAEIWTPAPVGSPQLLPTGSILDVVDRRFIHWSVFETTNPFQTLLLGYFPRWIQATNLTDLGNIQSGVSGQTSRLFFWSFFKCSMWTATVTFYLNFKVSHDFFQHFKWKCLIHIPGFFVFITSAHTYECHPQMLYLHWWERCIITNEMHLIWSISFTCRIVIQGTFTVTHRRGCLLLTGRSIRQYCHQLLIKVTHDLGGFRVTDNL